MRRLIGLVLLLTLVVAGCSNERPTEPKKIERDPFGKGGRLKNLKPQ